MLVNKIQVLLEALLSSQNHMRILADWDIIDAGFSIRFLFLVHFYKIKFIKLIQERINANCMNKFSDPSFYKNGNCTFFASAYKFIFESIKSIHKIRGINVFQYIFFEIIGKCIHSILIHYSNIVTHPKYNLTEAQMTMTIKEIDGLPGVLDQIFDLCIKEYAFDLEKCKKEFRLSIFNRIRMKTIQNILDIFLRRYQSRLKEEFSKSIIGTNFPERMKKVKEDLNYFSDIPNEHVSRFELKQARIFMGEFFIGIMDVNSTVLKEKIKSIEKDGKWYLSEFKNVDCSNENLFFDYLTDFLLNSDKQKCKDSISVLAGLLDPPLKKVDLVLIVSKKIYNPNQDFESSIRNLIFDHFLKVTDMEDALKLKKSASRKMHIMGIQLKFLMRIKPKKQTVGNNKGFHFLNNQIAASNGKETDHGHSIKRLKVEITCFSRSQMKNVFANVPQITL